MRALIVLAVVIVIGAFLLGCACPSGEMAAPVCPKCRVQMVKHRFLKTGVPGHAHAKYICPDCCAEWSGEEMEGEGYMCSKCGCGLKECPGCMAKGKG